MVRSKVSLPESAKNNLRTYLDEGGLLFAVQEGKPHEPGAAAPTDFAKSIAEHDLTPALGWYNALRSKTKPIKVNAEWLKQVPEVDDRRPGASLEKIPALKSQAPQPEPAAQPEQNPPPAQPEKRKD